MADTSNSGNGKLIVGQIKSTVLNALIILFGAPCASIGLMYLNGELKTWADFPNVLDHAMFAGACMTFAWIGMASPLSGRLKTMLSSVRTDSDGQQTLKAEIENAPGQATIAKLDQEKQTVTVTTTGPSLGDSQGEQKTNS